MTRPGTRPARWTSSGMTREQRTYAMCVAVSALLVVMLWAFIPAKAFPQVDLLIYREGGRQIVQHKELYDLKSYDGLPFTYPPFAAVLFTVLTPFGDTFLKVIVLIGTWLMLLRVAWLVAGRLARPLRPGRRGLGPDADELAGGIPARQWWFAGAIALAMLGTGPNVDTFALGQINLLLAWLIAEDLLGHRTGRWRGILVGVCVGIKLTPGIFLLALIATRQWRAAVNAVAGTLATIAISAVVVPHDTIRFFTKEIFDSSRPGLQEITTNQSLNGMVWRVLGYGGNKPVWAVLVLLTLALGALCVIALHRAGDTLGVVCAAGTVGTLISPVSWVHHWVWLLPGVLVLFRYVSRHWPVTDARFVVLAQCYAVFYLAETVRFERTIAYGPPDVYEVPWWVQPLTNAHEVIGLALLVALTLLARRFVRDTPVGVETGAGTRGIHA